MNRKAMIANLILNIYTIEERLGRDDVEAEASVKECEREWETMTDEELREELYRVESMLDDLGIC